MRGTTLAVAVAVTLGIAAAAAAQTPMAGEVGRVEGTAAVARGAAPQGTPLKIKDDLFLRDLVTTGQQSKAQLFLGQKGRPKATVTMREQSALRITEVPGVATVAMSDGLLKLSVLKDRMKPGDRVDVKTPNAITAVRGTTIVVEVSTTPSGPTTRLTVLNGVVDITPVDPATGVPRGIEINPRAAGQFYDLFERVDGFDEAFAGYGKEDSELRNRMRNAGARGISLWARARLCHVSKRVFPSAKRPQTPRDLYEASFSRVRASVGLSSHASDPSGDST